MKKRGPYLRKPEIRRHRRKLNFIREYREDLHWTQEKLAEESGYSVSSISAYERLTEDGNEPSIEALYNLAKALRTTPGKLLDVDPTKAKR